MRSIIAAIFALMAFVGCTKDVETPAVGDAVRFSAVNGATSRASDETITFDTSDTFGIFQEDNSETQNAPYTFTSDGEPLSGYDPFYSGGSNSEVFYAYHPYAQDNTLSAVAVAAGDDLLISNAKVDDDNCVKFTFTHAMSMLSLTIEPSDEHPDLTGLKVSMECATSGSYSLEDNKITTSNTGVIELTLTSGANNTYTAEEILIPGDYTDVKLIFRIGDDVTYTAKLDEEFVSGTNYIYSATIGNGFVDFEITDSIAWGDKSFTTGEIDIAYDSTNETYEIYTANGLWAFADLVNGDENSKEAVYVGGDDNFTFKTLNTGINGKLMADINLEDDEWTPIGYTYYDDNTYKGNFDGNGYEVSGLKIVGTSNNISVGLFGYVNGSTIKDLGVSGYITGSSDAGGIVGCCNTDASATILSCYSEVVIGVTSSGVGYAGGIVAYCGKGATLKIINCYNLGSINATNSAGGIVGYVYYNYY